MGFCYFHLVFDPKNGDFCRVATPKLKIKIQSFFRDFSEYFSVFFRVKKRKIQSFVDLLACEVNKKFRVFSEYIAENQCQSILVKKHAGCCSNLQKTHCIQSIHAIVLIWKEKHLSSSTPIFDITISDSILHPN